MFGMVKTLTIKDKVYFELKTVKAQNESFSDLFERMVAKEIKGITEFAGFLSKEDAEIMKKGIKDHRINSKKLNSNRMLGFEKQW